MIELIGIELHDIKDLQAHANEPEAHEDGDDDNRNYQRVVSEMSEVSVAAASTVEALSDGLVSTTVRWLSGIVTQLLKPMPFCVALRAFWIASA